MVLNGATDKPVDKWVDWMDWVGWHTHITLGALQQLAGSTIVPPNKLLIVILIQAFVVLLRSCQNMQHIMQCAH